MLSFSFLGFHEQSQNYVIHLPVHTASKLREFHIYSYTHVVLLLPQVKCSTDSVSVGGPTINGDGVKFSSTPKLFDFPFVCDPTSMKRVLHHYVTKPCL